MNYYRLLDTREHTCLPCVDRRCFRMAQVPGYIRGSYTFFVIYHSPTPLAGVLLYSHICTVVCLSGPEAGGVTELMDWLGV